MSQIVRSKMLFLNSAGRSTGEIYDFSINLPVELVNRIGQEEEAIMHLISITTKYSFYNIDTDRNNSFDLYVDTVTDPIILTPGNYNVTQLAAEIQTQLNAASSGLTWNVTYNTKTNRFTYVKSGGTVVRFEFDLSKSANRILGFLSDFTFTSNTETSEIIISIGNPETMLINCGQVTDTKHISYDVDHNHAPILGQIPILTAPFSTIYWEKQSDFSFHIKLKHDASNTLSFSFRDKDENLIKFTDDITMIFKMDIIKRSKISDEHLLAAMLLSK